MQDRHTTIQMIKQKVAEFNQERDWGQFHSPRNLSMALNVEASELMELFLWSRDDGPQPPVDSRKQQVEEEAADVMICLLNFCLQMNLDLAAAVDRKLIQNAEKYPVEKAKGRSEKSHEL